MKKIIQKRSRKLKGMTLMEVIIAMVVLVIVSVILITGAMAVVTNTKTARNVAAKTAAQAPYADNHINADAGTEITIDLSGAGSNSFKMIQYEINEASDPSDRVGNYGYLEYVPKS